MRKSIKAATLAGLLLFGSMTTSCYGSFQLTRNFYNWNGSIENKWGREGIYLITGIVYAITFLGDSLIFNSIEFWGGDNPIEPSMAKAQAEMDQVAALVGVPCEIAIQPIR